MQKNAKEQPPTKRGASVRLLDDRHDPLSEDVFGHGDYARALADALQIAPDGMTLGLFGEWGMGKSSVLHALPAAMGPTAAVVIFDAWRYGEDAFRREFLRDVAERLVELEVLDGFDVGRDLADLDIDAATPHEFFKIGRPRLVGFATFVLLLLLSWLAVNGRILDTDAAGKLSLVALIGLVGLVATRLETLTKVQTRTETRRRLEDADRFARRFRELLSAVKTDHLIIAVDNVDRLEPAAAMDVLATVKTYLEPATDRPRRTAWQVVRFRHPAPTKVSFVVAVDADALVEHQASQQSGRAIADRPRDDFLRKFFAARITLRALLDDDIQAFVRRRVEPVVDAWAPDQRHLGLESLAHWRARQITTLTDLIVAGVRRNPRRLKQFINSLHMALLMLDVRYRRGQIPNPPTELDLVAQLVFIEEDCPRIFRNLLANPSLLDELHVAAQGSGALPLSDAEEWARLLPVLRSTFSVNRSRARTYLRLKVTDIEQRLPDHDAIRAALRAGDVDEVELRLDPVARGEVEYVPPRLVAKPSASAAAWARHLPELVRQELAGGRTDIVFNILRCLLETEVLFACTESAVETVERAMALPEIRDGGWRLPVRNLLGLVDQLSRERRQPVFDALGRWYGSPIDATPEQLDAVAQALADRDLPLSEPVLAGLRESLAAQPRLGQFDYAPIVQLRPDVFPESAIDTLLGLFDEATQLRSTSVQPPTPDPNATMETRAQGVATIRTWLDGRGHQVVMALVNAERLGLDRRFGNLLRSMLDNSQWDDAVRDRVLSTIASAVCAAPTVDDQAIEDLAMATRVYVTLGQYVTPASLLAVASCLHRHRAPTAHRPEIDGALSRLPGERLAAIIAEADGRLATPLRRWLLELAEKQSAQDGADKGWSSIVRRLDPEVLLADTSPDAIAEAFRGWVADPDHQDDLIVAVGDAGFDDRAAVVVEGVGLNEVVRLDQSADDLDEFGATLLLDIEARISLEAEDAEPSAGAESQQELEVSATLHLRRDPADPAEIVVTLIDVIL